MSLGSDLVCMSCSASRSAVEETASDSARGGDLQARPFRAHASGIRKQFQMAWWGVLSRGDPARAWGMIFALLQSGGGFYR